MPSLREVGLTARFHGRGLESRGKQPAPGKLLQLCSIRQVGHLPTAVSKQERTSNTTTQTLSCRYKRGILKIYLNPLRSFRRVHVCHSHCDVPQLYCVSPSASHCHYVVGEGVYFTNGRVFTSQWRFTALELSTCSADQLKISVADLGSIDCYRTSIGGKVDGYVEC